MRLCPSPSRQPGSWPSSARCLFPSSTRCWTSTTRTARNDDNHKDTHTVNNRSAARPNTTLPRTGPCSLQLVQSLYWLHVSVREVHLLVPQSQSPVGQVAPIVGPVLVPVEHFCVVLHHPHYTQRPTTKMTIQSAKGVMKARTVAASMPFFHVPGLVRCSSCSRCTCCTYRQGTAHRTTHTRPTTCVQDEFSKAAKTSRKQ